MLPGYGLPPQHYHTKCSSVLYKTDFFDPRQEDFRRNPFWSEMAKRETEVIR